MLILDKRKAVERVVALTVAGAAAEPEPRPRRTRRKGKRAAKRAQTPCVAAPVTQATVEATEQEPAVV